MVRPIIPFDTLLRKVNNGNGILFEWLLNGELNGGWMKEFLNFW